MKKLQVSVVSVLMLCAFAALAAGAEPVVKILLDGSKGHWRAFSADRTPELVSDDGQAKPLLERPGAAKAPASLKPVPVTGSPAPPNEWTAADFNDGAWVLRKTPCEPEHRGGYPNDGTRGALYGQYTSLLCLRGSFEIDDPADCKDLQLVLEYHGGVIVYVNGEEIKRQDIAAGPIKPETVALPYPNAGAYTKDRFKTFDAFRVRRLRLDLPQKLWRKGANTVAIEVRRAPLQEAFVKQIMDAPGTGMWPHIRVIKAEIISGWGLSDFAKVKVRLDRSVRPRDLAIDKHNILNTQAGYWRMHLTWKTPDVVDDQGQVKPLLESFNRNRHKTEADRRPFPAFATGAAGSGWEKPDFDDSAWTRRRGGLGLFWNGRSSVWAPNNANELKTISYRGKFEVKKPEAAKDLALYLEFHGGVVAYINGREIGRSGLPAGPLEPDTAAEPYAREAYYRPDGRFLSPQDNAAYASYIRENRVRALQADVPADALRAGINVLAIEVRRSPLMEAAATASPWGLAALRKAVLCARSKETLDGAVVPNTGPAERVGAWTRPATASKLLLSEHANACEKPAPIRLAGVPGGAFGGLAVVQCDEPIVAGKATVTDLKSSAGTLPASAVEILYPRLDGPPPVYQRWPPTFDSLPAEPPETVEPDKQTRMALFPVWIKVRVPPETKPGEYAGELTIAFQKGIKGLNVVNEKPIRIPILLKLHAWQLPRPQDARTFVDMIQSPETVAIRYKVPLWSDEHFKYLEKSLALLGECGNKTTYIRTMNKNHFGDSRTIIRFVKGADGEYTRDYSVLDRYMDLVEKHQGKPQVVILYAWERYCLIGTAQGPLVSELDPGTGAIREISTPKYGTPEGVAFWKPVFDELRERLGKRGLEKALMIGAGGDFTGPSKEGVEFFKQVAPGLPWVYQGHGVASSAHGVPVGYCTTVWNARGPGDPRTGHRTYGWKSDSFFCQFDRDLFVHAGLPSYRQKLEWNIAGGQRGIGRMGGDFWDVLKAGEKTVTDSRHSAGGTLVNRYGDMGSWGQLVVRTRMINAGKDGAIPSIRYEALREGLQDCEARIFIERALLDPASRAKLGVEVAKRAQTLLDHRTWMLAGAQRWNDWFVEQDFDERQNALYGMAAEVAALLGAK